MSPAEDARQRLAAGKLTLQEARAIIEEHLRVGLAKGSDEEKRRIAGLVKTWRHQSSLGARGNAVDRNSLDDQTIRSSTWLDWLWTPDSGSSSGSSSRRRSTSASGKQQGDPSDGSGRGSSGRNSQGSEGSSSDADASDDSRLSDRLSGARLSERASDLDPRVGIALVRYSDAIMAFNDAQATMSQGIAGDKKARIAMEERLSRAVALETAATTAAVHGVPHNRLGDSKGPVAAECNRRKVLRVDGGLDCIGQGLPGLSVYLATCALFKGCYEGSLTYAFPLPFFMHRQ